MNHTGQSENQTVLWTVIGTIILLMIAVIVLFFRMNQLQNRILGLLAPFEDAASRDVQEMVGLEVGSQAPDFILPDVEGQLVSLAGLSGERILLFTSSSCPHCRNLLPELESFHRQNPDVQLVVINTGSITETAQMAAEGNLTFPILSWQPVPMDYRVQAVPFSFVVDDQGFIVDKGPVSGVADLAEMSNGQ